MLHSSNHFFCSYSSRDFLLVKDDRWIKYKLPYVVLRKHILYTLLHRFLCFWALESTTQEEECEWGTKRNDRHEKESAQGRRRRTRRVEEMRPFDCHQSQCRSSVDGRERTKFQRLPERPPIDYIYSAKQVDLIDRAVSQSQKSTTTIIMWVYEETT